MRRVSLSGKKHLRICKQGRRVRDYGKQHMRRARTVGGPGAQNAVAQDSTSCCKLQHRVAEVDRAKRCLVELHRNVELDSESK